MFAGLYEKREATPGRSSLGCLVATGGLVAICAVYYFLEDAAFVFGRPGAGQAIIAQRGAAAMEAALEKVIADAEVQDFRDLFREDVRRDYPALAGALAKHSVLARGVLSQGASYPLLTPEAARKLQGKYLEVRRDPWDRPYQVIFSPASLAAAGGYWGDTRYRPLMERKAVVFSLGPDGKTGFGTGSVSRDDIFSMDLSGPEGP